MDETWNDPCEYCDLGDELAECTCFYEPAPAPQTEGEKA